MGVCECIRKLIRSCASLPQPLPFHIGPQPSPVVRLISEALGLYCQVLGLVGWNTTLVDVDGQPLLERFDVRDQGRASHDPPVYR